MSKSKVFGCSIQSEAGAAFLDEALEIVSSTMAEKEGIYRFSPNLADLVAIQHKMNHGEKVDLRSLDANMLAGLVKCYFRELEPEPVIPFDSYESLIEAVQEEHYKILIMGILDEVPYDNIILLAKLCHHLHYVSTKSEQNKMPPDNLAIVWAQNLLKPRVETPATILGDVLYVNDLAAKLITEVDYFFSEQAMQRRKAEWDALKSNPEALKKKEEEKKAKKKEREKEKEKEENEEKGDKKTDSETYDVKYRAPKSLTYKAMKLNVTYEGGVKFMDGKGEIKEHYTIDQIRWIARPVDDTVSIDFGSHRSLNNGFLIVKTSRAKELESVLNDLKEKVKEEEQKRRMAPVPNGLKWNSEEEIRRRKENKRKINDEWVVDFMAKKPTENISTEDRKQLRKSLQVRYAIKKRDNPVRAAIQEQMKDNKMADFFGRMVSKVKAGNYTLKQLDAWLKWIGSRLFGKGGPSEIPKELLEMDDEENVGSQISHPPTIKEGGGSGILTPRGPSVTPEQLRRTRPITQSAPMLPSGRSVIVRPTHANTGGSAHSSGPIPVPPRPMIVKQKSFDGLHINNSESPEQPNSTAGGGEGGSPNESDTSPKVRSKGYTCAKPPMPVPSSPRNRHAIMSSYPAPHQTSALSSSPPTTKVPPPIPYRDRSATKNVTSNIGATTTTPTTTTTSATTPTSHPTAEVSASSLAAGKSNMAALSNGKSSFIPRNRNATVQATTPQHNVGLTAIPLGSKSVRPPAPPRNPNMKLSEN